jgi:hypothetical protein
MLRTLARTRVRHGRDRPEDSTRSVQEAWPELRLAYWHERWRRDEAPLLDELAASVDHVEPFSKGGNHSAANFATVCSRCNARKSAISKERFLSVTKPWEVKGKHGEPTLWDGLASAFVVLAKSRQRELSASERQWHAALSARLYRMSDG